MSEKELEELKKTCKYLAPLKEMTKKDKKTFKEIHLREMVNSVYCYGYNVDLEYCLNNRYITDFLEEDDKYYTFSLEELKEIVNSQLDFLDNHCRIERDVYADSDGLTYNSLIEIDK